MRFGRCEVGDVVRLVHCVVAGIMWLGALCDCGCYSVELAVRVGLGGWGWRKNRIW